MNINTKASASVQMLFPTDDDRNLCVPANFTKWNKVLNDTLFYYPTATLPFFFFLIITLQMFFSNQ